MPALTDKDIDAEIASDWQEILARQVEDEPAPEPVEAEPAEETPPEAPPPEAAAAKATPDRKPNGQFKPKEAKSETPEPVPVEEPPQPEGQQRDTSRAPSTWRPTARAEFAKLPPIVQAEIYRRESDFMAGQSQLLPDAKFGKEIRQVVEPYRMLIESEGGTPESAVQELLRTAAVLRTGTPQQKYQTMAAVAQRYGIDLRAFAPRPAQGGQPGTQPAQQQFRDPRVDQLLQQMQSEVQSRQQTEQKTVEDAATRWMNEADAEGNPKRPYVADVINEMTAMIPHIKAADPTLTHAQALESAYERAIWAHPEIRQLLVTEQQAAATASRAAENQQRTQAARRAASVNVPRRASTPAPVKPGSLEETIAATARELGIIG